MKIKLPLSLHVIQLLIDTLVLEDQVSGLTEEKQIDLSQVHVSMTGSPPVDFQQLMANIQLLMITYVTRCVYKRAQYRVRL